MAVVYSAMILGTLPAISRGAGGQIPFDMRPFGYSTLQARDFLGALTDEARDIYVGPQRYLDLVFPALLGVAMAGVFLAYVPQRGLRRALILLALCAVFADYVENLRVARMLAHDGPVPEILVTSASQATVAKAILTGSSLVALAAVGITRWRAR
jgi:hypothetical protein